jgi:hypothetical protein
MGPQDVGIYQTYKKYERIIFLVEGLLIIVGLMGLWVYFYMDYQIKQEINEKCGWGDEDYQCYCERNKALEIKNILDGNQTLTIDLSSIENVSFYP